MPDAPTVPPPAPDSLSSSLRRNIQALEDRREQEAANASLETRIAGRITAFTGSMWFVYIHLVLYSAWILLNLGIIPGVPKFDPSFVILAMEASVEAIFLSTFVLITQNRMADAANKRADLDLQISLLTEHELTKLVDLVTGIRSRLDLDPAPTPEIEEIRKDVAPEAVNRAVK
ncbi:MAG TPA: DUF1003 domain-containing protein [Rhodopila sp.]|nr:DUF1003 domain-containing protein [Rhodopila sp.]